MTNEQLIDTIRESEYTDTVLEILKSKINANAN